MAVRTPVYFDGTDIKQMSTAQVEKIYRKVKYLYSASTPITLDYVASGGNLGGLIDTRKQAGTYTTHPSVYATPSSPTSTISVTEDHVSETRATATYSVVDSNNRKFPCFLDGSNDVQAMTDSDFIDTFIKPALQTYLTTDTTSDSFGGIYHIQSASSYSGSTLVNATPIFVDTRANSGAYSGVIPYTQDQPTNITSYYLHKKNDTDSLSEYDIPLHVYDGTGDAYTPDSATFNEVLQNMVRYCATFVDSCRISYALVNDSDTVYTKRGTGMVNTILNSQTVGIYFAGADDYRTQYYPSGTAITANTYYLGLTIT